MKTEIVRGAEADSLLAQDAFRVEWSRLGGQCPWATAFQTPGFVVTWYDTYRDRAEPVLVLSRAGDGRPLGLLPLAVTAPDDRLVVAGGGQAEYHAWISPPDLGDAFAWHAVEAIRREFPSKSLGFRYLPPNTPTGWLARPGAKRTCSLRARRRPLMRFGDGGGIAASLGKESNKARLRRLGKVGRTEFKRVTDPTEFDALFDAIIRCYDTRRMSLGGSAPFRDDGLKKPFYRALMRVPGLLHVTVLKVGDRVAAAHLGACGAREVQLGLVAHDPFLVKHSPGKLLILFLARMLWQEGYEQLDLTAGGEPYKERFANAWDEVHTLGAFPTPLARRKAVVLGGVEDAAKATLHRFGIRPEQARSVASGLKRLRPARAPAVVFGRARAWIRSRRETRVYSHGVATAPHPDGPPLIRRDALEDLLDHHPSEAWPSRQGFLSAALDRIEDGQHFYTYTEGGRLLHLGWLAERPTEALVGRAIPGFRLPPASALVLDLDTAPEARGRGLGALSLRAMLRDASRIPGTERAYIAVPADDGPARRAVEEVGFIYERSLLEETRFGRSRRSTVPPATGPGGAYHRDVAIGVPTDAPPKRPAPTPAER